jgi:hypothetical protein
LWNDVDNWINITNSQNSVRKKSFGRTFTLSHCYIIGLELDTGSLVLIVFVLTIVRPAMLIVFFTC